MKNQIVTKAFALTCLFSLLTEIVYPSVVSFETNLLSNCQASAINSSAESEPVADQGNNMVDLYTGDFNYGVPLMSVPGPNGENVNISLNYHGGIRVNEKASWVGLGWDYNPGEISRQIVGVADDYSGQPVYQSTIGIAGGETNPVNSQLMYGPFYYDKMTGTTYPYAVTGSGNWVESCDMIGIENQIAPSQYSTTVMTHNSWTSMSDNPPRHFGKPIAPALAAAYDQYHISGPGISGKLKPLNFGSALFRDRTPNNNYYPTKQKTQFYFDNSTTKSKWAPDGTNNRIKSGYFVKYYTNTEINNNSNLFSNTTQIGFLDYRLVTTGTRRPTTDFDGNSIGGIEVTDPTGITYHYSLPVYTKEEVSKSLHYTTTAKDEIGLTQSNILKMGVVYKKYPFANSWKLTSVTGPDYQDVNGNKIVDEGDKGYWISYNYALWNNAHISTTNVYNATDNYLKQASRLLRLNGFGGAVPPSFRRTYNIAQSQNQIYYLNNIKTATHTAFFVKDVRLDEHSYDNVLFSSTKPHPLLKLNRVILLRNEDKNLIQNATAWNSANVDSRFNKTLCTSPLDGNLIHIDKYLANKTLIDAKSIKSVELKTDYSLCKKLYNNINNTFSSAGVTKVNWAGSGILNVNSNSSVGYAYYNKTAGYSTTDANNSGKLTLTEVISYEDVGVKIFPSYLFDYDKTSSTKNPDFDPEKCDLWGFYKSDFSGFGCSHYPTPTSASDVDAWSLKEITTPVGQKIKIEYEPDEYEKEGYNDDPWNPILAAASTPPRCKPTLLYPINTFNTSNAATTFIYKDYHTICASSYNSGGNMLLNFLVVPRLKSCATWAIAVPPPWYSILCYEQGVPNTPIAYTPSGDNVEYTYPFGFTHANNMSVMVGGTMTRPDISTMGCSAETDYGYDRTNAYGYMVMKFNKLYGGGTRVKTITFSDPDYPSDTYKQKLTYTKGYCPVVPVQFMLGPQTNFTQFMLWDNLKMLVPENGGSQVGYDNVNVATINKYGTTNGSTTYYFQNATIYNPVQTIIVSAPIYTFNPTCTPHSVCGTYPGTGYKIVGDDHIYNIESHFNNQEAKMLGKLTSVNCYDKGNFLVSKTSYVYETNREITEGFQHDVDYDVHLPFIKKCNYGSSGPPISNSCYDRERYRFKFVSRNFTPSLKSISKMVDGITNTTVFYNHPDLNDPQLTIVTSQTEPNTKLTKSYAFRGIPALGRKDSAEVCKNQVLLPSKVVTARGNWIGYLTNENTISYTNSFNYRTYNSGTGLYENSSSTKNWYTPDETSSRLLDDKTMETSLSTPVYRVESKTSLFNQNNVLLEEKGLNNRCSAVKFGYNNLFKLSSISNANYNSFTYSGYEDTITVASGVRHFGGEITGGQYVSSPIFARFSSGLIPLPILSSLVFPHTGNYFAKVPPNTYGPTYNGKNIEKGRRYRAQVWVHKESPNDAKLVMHLTGTSLSSSAINQYIEIARNNSANVQVGDWILMTIELDVPSNLDLALTHNLAAYVRNLSSTTTAYYDDFNLHPIDAPITGNVYDLRTGRIIATLDEENYATKYNYDAAGRVVSVIKETKTNGLVKIMEKGYHNSRP